MTAGQTAAAFLAVAAILLTARLLGAGAKAIGQPPVLGEILVGIVLGPTLFHGTAAKHLFPSTITPFLSTLATLGLALFMFGVGYEMEFALIRGRVRTAAGVSFASILLPFGLGALLALHLVHRHATVSRTGFVLFIGAAMSVTAFPVLARILTDRRMQRTRVGSLALACAAIDDVVAWSLLAAVTTIVAGATQWHIMFAPLYLAVMVCAVRPLFARLFDRSPDGKLTPSLMAGVLAGLMLSCWATEQMGMQYMFGAFAFGLLLPRGGARQIRDSIRGSVENVGATFLLPVFFVTAGLKVDLSHVNGAALGELGLILLVAIIGKFTGAFAGARLQGVSTRDSGVLATLMNTRGLTELVILSAGLQLGILDTRLYSLMVVMAVVTTFMAGPILRVLYPRPLVALDTDDAEVLLQELELATVPNHAA
ncbi:cation:proton antiporter [Streptacidiphilus sp. PAMC 29251]